MTKKTSRRRNTFSMYLLILIPAISLPQIATVAAAPNASEHEDADPMLMVKTTLKSWHTMYNSYREEINLGYCWADYFVDIKRLLTTMSGPRVMGINPDDPSPLIAILKNWFDDGKGDVRSAGEKSEGEAPDAPESSSIEESDEDYYYPDQEANYHQDHYLRGTEDSPPRWEDVPGDANNDADQFTLRQREPLNGEKSAQYFYPGIYNSNKDPRELGRSSFSSARPSENLSAILNGAISKIGKYVDDYYPAGRKSNPRALSDLFISALGLNVPPGLGPLMIGVQHANPLFFVISRLIGTFMRVGRQVLETIETTSFLACTKEYLLVKIFRWIDS